MKRFFTLMFFLSFALMSSQAQNVRYLNEVFTDVTVANNQIYGMNATVLAVAQVGEAIPQPLVMDVYQPAGDSLSERPVVLLWHTGNFLPHPQNGSVGGTIHDSTMVELANRLARMGYVVAVCDYRLGWNPIAPDQLTRVFTLINAAYRGVQDVHTAVKYFKRSVAEMGNPFKVDDQKIIVWGVGTGGYLALNAASLDNYLEIPLTPGGKFVIVDSSGNIIPMVVEQINGDLNCDSVGIVPPGYPGFPAGDTLNYPNHVGYDGSFQMAVNMGGACGDTSWVDAGQVPHISYHVPTDPFAPYKIGLVIVPGFNLPVVEVAGSYTFQMFQNRYDNNAPFAGKAYAGDFSDVANARNDGYDGLFPLIGHNPFDSAPWEWWDTTANVNSANGLQTNPDMSAEKARSYIDTIMAYFAPRACEVLGLDCSSTGVEELRADKFLNISPVPSSGAVNISVSEKEIIHNIAVYNLNGKMIFYKEGMENSNYTLNRNGLPSGMYIVRIGLNSGMATSSIIFE